MFDRTTGCFAGYAPGATWSKELCSGRRSHGLDKAACVVVSDTAFFVERLPGPAAVGVASHQVGDRNCSNGHTLQAFSRFHSHYIANTGPLCPQHHLFRLTADTATELSVLIVYLA